MTLSIATIVAAKSHKSIDSSSHKPEIQAPQNSSTVKQEPAYEIIDFKDSSERRHKSKTSAQVGDGSDDEYKEYRRRLQALKKLARKTKASNDRKRLNATYSNDTKTSDDDSNASTIDNDIKTIETLITMLTLANQRLIEQRRKANMSSEASEPRKSYHRHTSDTPSNAASNDHIVVKAGFNAPKSEKDRKRDTGKDIMVGNAQSDSYMMAGPRSRAMSPYDHLLHNHRPIVAHDLLHVDRSRHPQNPPEMTIAPYAPNNQIADATPLLPPPLRYHHEFGHMNSVAPRVDTGQTSLLDHLLDRGGGAASPESGNSRQQALAMLMAHALANQAQHRGGNDHPAFAGPQMYTDSDSSIYSPSQIGQKVSLANDHTPTNKAGLSADVQQRMQMLSLIHPDRQPTQPLNGVQMGPEFGRRAHEQFMQRQRQHHADMLRNRQIERKQLEIHNDHIAQAQKQRQNEGKSSSNDEYHSNGDADENDTTTDHNDSQSESKPNFDDADNQDNQNNAHQSRNDASDQRNAENDPDFKHIQSLAGGDTDFTDLFPAGILSDAEIKEMREQQKEQKRSDESNDDNDSKNNEVNTEADDEAGTDSTLGGNDAQPEAADQSVVNKTNHVNQATSSDISDQATQKPMDIKQDVRNSRKLTRQDDVGANQRRNETAMLREDTQNNSNNTTKNRRSDKDNSIHRPLIDRSAMMVLASEYQERYLKPFMAAVAASSSPRFNSDDTGASAKSDTHMHDGATSADTMANIRDDSDTSASEISDR